MGKLLGEFEIKIDTKGRFKMPAAYLKQLGDSSVDYFVVNKGLHGNLVIYPKVAWERETEKVDALNEYDPANAMFIDLFYSGIDEVHLDKSGRFLIKKRLLDSVGIGSDVVLSATAGKIKVWDKTKYEERTKFSEKDFAAMAAKVLGRSKEE